MDISSENYVSIDVILADVLKVVSDGSFKLNSKGWYTSQIQQSLEELSFDTFFNERSEVLDIPDNLRVMMPKGAFNIRGVYLVKGDKCRIDDSVNVWYKPNFENSLSGNGYTARDRWNNKHDPFYKGRTGNSPNNLFYYGMQNGLLMLSESCSSYSKIRLVYNGISTDIGEAPIIPQYFRQAVKDWVTVKALEIKLADVVGTNEYSHWAGMLNRYDNSLSHPYEGSWVKAERRAKTLNTKERKDIKEYMSRFNY